MANYSRLTQKQIEALKPLEADAKANRKTRDRLQKRLALESYIGFEENRAIKERIADLDEEYKGFSVKIADIYAAESVMMGHMRTVLAEVEEVRKIANRWGFNVEV